jgi:death-on-curing family protein
MNLKTPVPKNLAIYQASNGALELKADAENETIWASQKQIAEIFGIDRTVVLRHLKNIFNDDELDKKVVCAKFAHTTQHGSLEGKTQTRMLECYSLDIILAVGYRTNSSAAIKFRQWAIQTLKQHITQGFTINRSRIEQNYQQFLNVVEDIKTLSSHKPQISTDNVLELITSFSSTWFSLESYDKQQLPSVGESQKEVEISADELYQAIEKLKSNLIAKKEATELFAQEKQQGVLKGILGNVMQAVFGEELYKTIEEKAAHLFYFIIKNHPFNDGNKRSGTFAFVWFLQKTNFDFRKKITPVALTALALLVAESNPKEKDKIIGLILLLLKG